VTREEAMMAGSTTIPASFMDLFQKQAFANLATLNSDGSPQVTPVWIDFDGTHIVVNTAKGRVKDRNLRREPRVAISLPDPANPYRYLGIQGRVVEMTEQGADAHIDKMAKKYLDKDTYPFRSPGEVRVLVKIKPEKVHTNG
jgi:PPOX class probable F420-dependent enzyme